MSGATTRRVAPSSRLRSRMADGDLQLSRSRGSERGASVQAYPSSSTERTLPAGSVNHAIGGPPSAREMPCSSCSKPS
jgi:hypothetical protein